MNLRKAIFVFGGSGLILVILAFRFGWFARLGEAFALSPPKNVAGHVRPASEAKNAKTPRPKPQKTAAAPKKAAPAPKKAAPVQSAAGSGEKLSAAPAAPDTPDAPAAPEREALGIGDPFSYSSSGTGDYSPLSAGRQVGGVSVKGIIRMEGRPARAILHLKDTGRVYYVGKGDVVRINTRAKTGSLITEAYIVVKEVRDEEVELIQQERPDKVIIVR